MLIVGLTGGIGSGKTTVANLFAQHQVAIIDADLIVRELLADPNIISQISTQFGNTVLTPCGTINRHQLRKIIFTNSAQKTWLEQLLHPLTITTITQQITHLSPTQYYYCIVVIPLLVETGPHEFLHRILVVQTPITIAINRAALRDKSAPAAIKKIATQQSTPATRIQSATEVINNNGTLDYLTQQVEQLHQYYKSYQFNPCV